MQHLVRSGAVNDARRIEPIMRADRLAQRGSARIGIAEQRAGGGRIGFARGGAGAERVLDPCLQKPGFVGEALVQRHLGRGGTRLPRLQ